MPGSPRSSATAATTGHGPVRRDGQHSVDALAATDLRDGIDVGEVDDLGDVGGAEARRGLVAVDRDDAQPPGLRMLDRAPLVPAAADEENRCHGRRW